MGFARVIAAAALALLASCAAGPAAARQVVGTGLVVGLNGTGSSNAAHEQMADFVARHGLDLAAADIANGSAAMVALTAVVPASTTVGSKLDIDCVLQGDGTSLHGGQLLRATLHGSDGRVYVVAQGPVTVATRPARRGKLLHGGLVIEGRGR